MTPERRRLAVTTAGVTRLTMLIAPMLGCQPELDSRCDGGDCPERGAGVLEISTEPDAPLDRAPSILRLHVVLRNADGLDRPLPAPDPRRVVLARGALGRTELGKLARDEPSAALAARLVPALAWAADDGHVVLAPSEELVPGELYSVACAELKLGAELVVASDDPLPRLGRLWPPPARSSSATTAVWCGAQPLPALVEPAVLAPSGLEGLLAMGALEDRVGTQCLRFVAASKPDSAPTTDATHSEPSVAPPAWPSTTEGALVRLDPRPLAIEAPAEPLAPRVCAAGELSFGPGCARVADDRLVLAPPNAPLLWSIVGAGLDLVTASEAGAPVLVEPLPVDSPIELGIAVADTAGEVRRFAFGVHTLPAMPHVVVNEVLANPTGPEPEQEWVELYNDGRAAAALADYLLVDAGGYTVLPGGTLAPGEHALVVNDDYDPSNEFDPSPAPGTLLLRVPRLGTNGLSNDGESLELRNQAGTTLSIFPPKPRPRSGVSVIRVHPKAVDGLDSSFRLAPAGPTPGSANLPAR